MGSEQYNLELPSMLTKGTLAKWSISTWGLYHYRVTVITLADQERRVQGSVQGVSCVGVRVLVP